MHALLRRRQQLDPAADRPDLAAAGSAEHPHGGGGGDV